MEWMSCVLYNVAFVTNREQTQDMIDLRLRIRGRRLSRITTVHIWSSAEVDFKSVIHVIAVVSLQVVEGVLTSNDHGDSSLALTRAPRSSTNFRSRGADEVVHGVLLEDHHVQLRQR